MELNSFDKKTYSMYGNKRDKPNIGHDRQRLSNYAYVAFYMNRVKQPLFCSIA